MPNNPVARCKAIRFRWPKATRRSFLVLLGAAAVLVGALFLFAPRFGDNTWRAKVISVDGDQVCTTPDEGERDPGWADPFCFDGDFDTSSGEAVPANVGRCVEIESSHPAFYVKGVVECG